MICFISHKINDISGTQLTDNLILELLQNGNCSDLDFDENDEDFLPVNDDQSSETPPPLTLQSNDQQSELPLDVADEEPGPSRKRKLQDSGKRPKIKVKMPQRARIWKKAPYIDKPHDYDHSTPAPELRSPTEYFSDYFDDDFYENMALCTNLYYLRKTGKVLNTTKQEIKKFVGIHLIMGILSYPRLAMYWRHNIKIEMIVSAMTRDRCMMLRNNLHVVDSDYPKVSDVGNPLWKVQPVINAVRNGCHKLERTPRRYSVDEQMIPFTGKCHMRQLVKNKPRPVGLKNFVVTTSEGLMLDFEIYFGNNPALLHPLGLGPGVVLRLSQSIPPGSCIFFDRFFTTIPLLEELKNRGYHGTGTIMANRIPNRQQLSFKEDKKMSRGEVDQRISDDIVLVKWKDSKAVLVASNCTGGTGIDIVQRYEKKEKHYVDVDAPKIVTSYNAFMGGVDVLDQSMEYYRTFMKTRKWTLKVILHFIDLAVVNSWRLYRNEMLANNTPKSKIQDLLSFRFEMGETLLNTPSRERHESSPEVEPQEQPLVRYRPANDPSVGKRYDGFDHFPIFDDIKAPRTCRLEKCKSRSKLRCRKCDVYLCLNRDKDCFYIYHNK